MSHRLALIVIFLFAMLSIGAFVVAQEESMDIKVKVELTTIDVFALNKQGQPVPNLKKEDFELFEDGKKQDIVTFDEVSGKASNSAIGASPLDDENQVRGKTVLIIFDDSSISPENVKRTRDSAMRFVQKNMQSQDQFAVATYVSTMVMLQNLTNDREDVLAAIAKSEKSNRGSMDFPNFLISLKSMTDSLARLNGRKTFILYTQPNYTQQCPIEREKTYKEAVDSAKRSNVIFYAVNAHLLGSSSMSAPISGMSRSGGPGGGMGSFPSASGGGGRSAIMGLNAFVSETGGTVEYDVSSIDATLDSLGQKISSYYILGYQSANPRRDDSFRKVEVKAKEKGIKLQHQAGYVDNRPVDLLGVVTQDQPLLTALVSPKFEEKIALTFRPAYFYDSAKLARVLIEARIPATNVDFRPKGNQLGTDLKVMGVAYAEDGSVAARFFETQPVRFSASIKEAREMQKASFAYRSFFSLHPGKYRIKLAVSDESNTLGTAEKTLEIPELREKEMAASSLLIAERASKVSETEQQLQSQLFDGSNPLLIGNNQIEPSVDDKTQTNAAVPVLFRLYNLPASPEQWNLSAKATLIDEKGGSIILDQFSLKNLISSLGNGQGVALASIPMKNAPAGKHQLKIDVTDAASSQSASLQTDIELVK